MAENEIVRATKETFSLRTSLGTPFVLMFLGTPPAIAAFLAASQSWGPVAPYFFLFWMGMGYFLFFAWAKATAWRSTTSDMAARFLKFSGWKLADVPLQLVTGMVPVAAVVMILWVIGAGTLKTPDLVTTALPLVLFFWFVVAPIETWIQAWVLPMALPFGPVSAQVAFLFLHGERAYDAGFAVFALMAGTYFWLLTFLRYLNHSRPGVSRWFGPVAAWSAHATWDTLLIWVVLAWPSL